jgi:hypothetical protein
MMDKACLTRRFRALGIAYLPSFLYADAMRQGLVEEAIPGLPVETFGHLCDLPAGPVHPAQGAGLHRLSGAALYDKGPDNW